MRIAFALLTALMIAAAMPAAAAGDAETIAACLATERKAGGDGRACIGKTSDPCLQQSGSDTQGMVECLDGEAKVWDDLLNADYQGLLASLAKPAANSVREAQRAWIANRDADCKVPYDIYEGGTIARIDSASCVLDHTAARVLQLRIWLQMARPDE